MKVLRSLYKAKGAVFGRQIRVGFLGSYIVKAQVVLRQSVCLAGNSVWLSWQLHRQDKNVALFGVLQHWFVTTSSE